MKTNILLIVAALFGGCVTNSSQSGRALTSIAQREHSYRDNGYSDEEASIAACRDAWQSGKEVKALTIPDNWNRSPLTALKVEPPVQSLDHRLVAGN